jgi:hypothetical protein
MSARACTSAWRADAGLDGGGTLARSRAVALGAGGAVCRTIGLPPMQYLTQWRLTPAAQALRAGGENIARIAERSGYDSEAAFTRAFKREFGVPPTVWRKTEASGPAVASTGRAASD